MKKIQTNLIILLVGFGLSFQSFCQINPDNYLIEISKEESEFVINATYINDLENNPPLMDSEFLDLVFAIKFPNNFDNSSLSLTVLPNDYNMIKNGTLKQGAGFKYQDFSMNAPVFLSQNWILNQPVEIVRISFSASNPLPSDEAVLAAINEITSNIPNINMDYEDYTPDVLGQAPLPITLTKFDVERFGERAARLLWSTESEINSSHFEIERSEDGLEWSYLGRVSAAENSTDIMHYNFIDDQLPISRNATTRFYYRLRMVDLDGEFDYSPVRSVSFRSDEDISIRYYPNPAVDFINIDIKAGAAVPLDAPVSLQVFDATGRLVVRKHDLFVNGINTLDVSQYPGNMFHLVLTIEDKVFNHSIVTGK
jgi:hypothetical protein